MSEPHPTGIVFPRRTPTITPPVPKGLQDPGEIFVVRIDGAALARRDMVRRIEAAGGDITERAGVFAAVLGPERIAIVLNEPQPIPTAKRSHTANIKRIP